MIKKRSLNGLLLLILGIPILSFIIGIIAIYLSQVHKEHVIFNSENHIKSQKYKNLNEDKILIAKKMKIKVDVTFQKTQLVVHLKKGLLSKYPLLKIKVYHKTMKDLDRTFIVKSKDNSGYYNIDTQLKEPSIFNISVEPLDGDWIVIRKANINV